MTAFEKLGKFYLGKVYDQETKSRLDQYYLYDAKDLTTHAVCVGMTGSGKTGLCIDLLEEAAMDNIPALIIDPKGDMTNLLLSFPDLTADRFLPWLQVSEADKLGMTIDQLAEATADRWKNGLEEWEIGEDRIGQMHKNAEISVYTPGSSAGKPLSIVQMVGLPEGPVLEDRELLNDYCSSMVSGLLALINIDADPLNSREHILLSNILLNQWQQGKDLDFPGLIQLILAPPMDKLGILPLDSFYPEKDRQALAMRFNNLLASPQFAIWMQGDPIDIDRLLFTEEGRPRLSIISINHLSDPERMFVVSTLLNKVLSWARAQSGTSALRAILYMDEIYGYFPPVENPPSKKPLLTLLKQARAYGLGIMLTTQNPVDLDYKGLANIGTWFIGRLQTEQDKVRLLNGLKSADAGKMDIDRLNDIISKLPGRTFLVNNVHEDGPELFQTRWAMSYLAGPLTRQQIALLKEDSLSAASDPIDVARPASTDETVQIRTESAPVTAADVQVQQTVQESPTALQPEQSVQAEAEPAAQKASDTAGFAADPQSVALLPQLPPEVNQYFYPADLTDRKLIYLPSLLAAVDVYFDNAKLGVQQTEQMIWNTPIEEGLIPVDWSKGTGVRPDPSILLNQPVSAGGYGPLPPAAKTKTGFNGWSKALVDFIYRNHSLQILKNKVLNVYSVPGESDRDFIIRTQLMMRERRDAEMDKIRSKYESKIRTMQERVRKAEQAVEREEDQAKAARNNTFLNIGSTILDSVLGTKRFGKSTASKASSTMRAANRTSQQKGDVERAEQTLENYRRELAELEQQLELDLQNLALQMDNAGEFLEPVQLSPKKSDIQVRALSLVWYPFIPTDTGNRPAFRVEGGN